MSRSTLVKPLLTSLACVLTGLLIGWLLFSGTAGSLLKTELSTAHAAPDLSQFRDPANPDAPLAVSDCFPYSVGVLANRIHIECSVSQMPAFRFFAMSSGASAQTARILSILEAAHVAGKGLWIGYDPADLSGQAIGCQNSDCRLITSAAIKP